MEEKLDALQRRLEAVRVLCESRCLRPNSFELVLPLGATASSAFAGQSLLAKEILAILGETQ